jgi:nitroimidazol reductase NimA-like FMN-containing flavoprotein (pyridoxamine 5'-phosphate oxidase superfamily)
MEPDRDTLTSTGPSTGTPTLIGGDPAMIELDADDCWALLRREEVGRLAVAIANHPDIFPINYVVDHGTVVFRTAEGTKLAASVLGIAVAFEIDGYDGPSGEAWSVVVKGRADEIEQMHDLFAAQDLPLFPWHASPKHRFVRIVPELVTGRRFLVTDRRSEHDAAGSHRTSHE